MTVTFSEKAKLSEYIEVPLDEPHNDLIDLTSRISFDDHPETAPLTGRCSKAPHYSKEASLITFVAFLVFGFITVMCGIGLKNDIAIYTGGGMMALSIAPFLGFTYLSKNSSAQENS